MLFTQHFCWYILRPSSGVIYTSVRKDFYPGFFPCRSALSQAQLFQVFLILCKSNRFFYRNFFSPCALRSTLRVSWRYIFFSLVLQVDLQNDISDMFFEDALFVFSFEAKCHFLWKLPIVICGASVYGDRLDCLVYYVGSTSAWVSVLEPRFLRLYLSNCLILIVFRFSVEILKTGAAFPYLVRLNEINKKQINK